jgi:hypothetical protein
VDEECDKTKEQRRFRIYGTVNEVKKLLARPDPDGGEVPDRVVRSHVSPFSSERVSALLLRDGLYPGPICNRVSIREHLGPLLLVFSSLRGVLSNEVLLGLASMDRGRDGLFAS